MKCGKKNEDKYYFKTNKQTSKQYEKKKPNEHTE